MSGIGIGLGIGLSRGGSAPPAWSPADLTPHVWLSAADLSSLYQDGGKTTAVTSDGASGPQETRPEAQSRRAIGQSRGRFRFQTWWPLRCEGR
jgi:hypothetical protein